MTSRTSALLPLLAVATACGQLYPAKIGPEQPPPPPVPTTSLTPPPGPFQGKVTVTLETDLPATIFVTTDGSDPHLAGPLRLSGASPITVELSRTTTLTYFSRAESGGEERVEGVSYLRTGGVPGTISGVVVVGGVAVGKKIALSANGTAQVLGEPPTAAELPFLLSGLDSGPHRLLAIADRNRDGNFWPIIDLTSDLQVLTLDLADPLKASAENVRLYLSASQPGLCTLKGTITLPESAAGQSLSVSALTSEALGTGADPAALLAQLRNGYQLFTNSSETRYPYVITNLEPGRYVPVPVLTGFGSGALAMNFLANPLHSLTLAAGEVGVADFSFGKLTLSGTASVTPTTAPAGLVYGIVAAKNVSLFSGIQGVLMPTVFLPSSPPQLQGSYAGSALRENATFQLRVFTSLDAQDPLTSALAWTVNPFASEPAHATAALGTTDVKLDLKVP